MAWINDYNLKMVVLQMQLIVVVCLINGRHAYRQYAADDAGNYGQDLVSNFSQIDSNEPPGKDIFSPIAMQLSVM